MATGTTSSGPHGEATEPSAVGTGRGQGKGEGV